MNRLALLLAAIAASACEPPKRGGEARPSQAEVNARVNAINRAADLDLLRAKVLDEPAQFIGWVERVSILTEPLPARRVTVRYVVARDRPEEWQGRIAFVVRGEGSLWRQDRTVLPLDSLKRGDAVKVWTQGRGVFHPTDPPLVSVKAVQRVDSLPPMRDGTRPTA